MKTRIKMIMVIGLALILCLAIYFILQQHPIKKEKQNNEQEIIQETELYIDNSPLNGLPISDNIDVYKNDIDDSVKYVYITALSTIDEATGEAVTLTNINKINKYEVDYNPEINIIFQEGNEEGPYSDIFTTESTQGNAIMRARGFSSRANEQKSFKIKLNSTTTLFMDQASLNLNKHQGDPLRMMNKLCFDLFESIPNFPSMRTQFVNIYIRDVSETSDAVYENYGLFTMVEQPNKLYLKTHGLDKNGNLYKAQNFSFASSPELLLESDPNYKEQAFESILEIEEGKDHTKLLNMLKNVENMNQDIDDIVDEHFNRDNYITWMALNIMLGNVDAVAQNYLLYSPVNSKTWYFLPWDYDSSLYSTEYNRITFQQFPETQYGLGIYWGVNLHRRFFKNPENVEVLSEKIEELRNNYITAERVAELTQGYKGVVKNYLTQMPDAKYLDVSIDSVFNGINSIDNIIQGNIDRYYKNLESPMPIWVSPAQINDDGTINFQWEYAYDIQGDQITYQLQIARDVDFKYLVFNGEEQIENNYTLSMDLPSDKYYYRVIIRDEHGHTQLSLEGTEDERGDWHQGIMSFEVQ